MNAPDRHPNKGGSRPLIGRAAAARDSGISEHQQNLHVYRLSDRGLLEALLMEVRALRAEIAAMRKPAEDLAPLAHAIAEAVGDRNFTAGELIKHAQFDDGLREAINGTDARQLAKQLLRMQGID